MAFRLFSRRRHTPKNSQPKKAPQFVESLEGRTMMSAAVQVVAIVADDRGGVQVRVNKALSTTSAGAANLKKALRIFAPGVDGNLNTVDDVQVAPSSISYDTATKTITIKAAALPINTNYRVKLFSSGITDNENLHLDGEYTGTYPSGNGVQGGNFEFRTKRDSSNLPTVRLETTLGLITIRMDKTAAPITVANFIQYVDTGKLDGTIFHRNSKAEGGTIDVLQGGSFYSTGASVATTAPIALEAGLPNIRGSIAMARAGDESGTATATSSFFLNKTDNAELNPNNGIPGWSPFGYAVFGNITSGLAVMDAIYALPTSNLGGATLNAPVFNGGLVSITRAAMQMKIAGI